MPDCRKCGDSFPNWARIKGKLRNLKNRRFCFTCSPFGSHNTRDIRMELRPSEKFCTRCQQVKSVEHDFYKRKIKARAGEPYSHCKSCINGVRAELKKLAVEYKGGSCQVCGYRQYLGALEFHHRNPRHKDFEFSRKNHTRELTRQMRRELDKCDLLCSNCHRETHAQWRARGVSHGKPR